MTFVLLTYWLISSLELGLLVSENIKVRMSVTFPARSHSMFLFQWENVILCTGYLVLPPTHSPPLLVPMTWWERSPSFLPSLLPGKWWVPTRNNSSNHFPASSEGQSGDCLSGPVCVCSPVLLRVHDTSKQCLSLKSQFSFINSLIDLFIHSVIFRWPMFLYPTGEKCILIFIYFQQHHLRKNKASWLNGYQWCFLGKLKDEESVKEKDCEAVVVFFELNLFEKFLMEIICEPLIFKSKKYIHKFINLIHEK